MDNYIMPKGDWKPISGYESYFISKQGEVFSTHSNRLLKLSTKTNGYIIANLWKDDKGRQFYIHRLVMEAFSPDNQKQTVNHKDGDKANNVLENLEWATYSENNSHALKNGLRKSNKNNKRMSTPVEQRDIDGNLLNTFPSFREAERKTGVNATSIGHGIRKGWKYGGYRWTLPS